MTPTTQQTLRLQRAESLVASLTADLATERERLRACEESRLYWNRRWSDTEERLRVAREKWDALFLCISDDQGYVYDADHAECVTCRSGAPTIAEIVHGEDCFTDLCGEMSRALAQLSAPVQAEQKEYGRKLKHRGMNVVGMSREEARQWVERYPDQYVLVERTKAGEWQDAEKEPTDGQ